jgi:FMN phosphatase YigB (HAD superfamily)
VAGVQPIVIGKPDPSLFRIALRRLGLAPPQAAMVGDTPAADIAGGRAAGMPTVLYAPGRQVDRGEADVLVRSFAELRALAGV